MLVPCEHATAATFRMERIIRGIELKNSRFLVDYHGKKGDRSIDLE